ncbi:MAG: XdhC family protein [Gammaproteobacteria bacterium]|nr:MAG: XdhC family protein [Gammaproteobacteria bacterium]
MQNYGSDQEVLETAHDWLMQGHEVALVTVLKTWGSSPRPPGSFMIMRRDGVHAGSVSGGCVEEDLLQRYRDRQLSDELPTRVDYGVNRLDAMRFGLPCGGRMELLVEQLSDQREQLEQLLTALRQHQLMARHVDLQTGQVSLQAARAEQDFVYTPVYVRKVLGPQWLMLLIGAGHLSRYVSQMALMLGYHVIVCDPREEYAQSWQVDGVELTGLMPDDAVQHYVQQPRSIVMALTHDPKLDDMALLDALRSPAFYVGAIGSRRNCELRRQRLRELGLSAEQLQGLHAPIGLPIGSHTPPEIAVSILAEITQLRNAVSHSLKQSVSIV